MQLDELVFKVNTTDLERANKLMLELGDSIKTLDGKITSATSKQSMAEARAARAAKDNAKARLDNAKAIEQEEKAEERKQKALDKSAAATEKAEKATKKQAESSDKVQKLIQTESDILEKLAQGLSLGEAKRVAYARSIGAMADQERELIALQEKQRQYRSDPFDNSASGLSKQTKELQLLTDAYRMNSAGLELTAKQARDLTRDKLRLIETAKLEGKGFSTLREEIRNLNADYISQADRINMLAASEKQSLQSKKDIASATRMIAQEDEKMAAALSQSNAHLNKATTDLLVKYETGLRRMGLSTDEMTKKLGAYKTQLASVAAEEEKRQQQHLARALSPQLTDIAVSLYSGQAPLTVLLQQGGQIADLFRLSGVEAQNFGKAMRDAFGSMIPVIATVATGMAQFAGSILMDVGRGVVNTTANLTGLTFVLDKIKGKLAAGGEENFKYIGSLTKMGNMAATVASGGIVALITALIAVGVEFKKIIQSEADLSRALATSGAALAMTKDEAVAMAESFKSVGVGALDASKVISTFAKETTISKDNLTEAMGAIVEYSKLTGQSVEDVAKQYEKLKDDPVKALIEIADKTGLIDRATLDHVQSLVAQGKQTEAVTAATKAWKDQMMASSAEIKQEQSAIESGWMTIKGAVSGVGKELYTLTKSLSESVAPVFRTVWQTIAVIVSEVWFTIKGVAREIGVVGAILGQLLTGNFSGAKTIWEESKADAVSLRAEHDKLIASIMNQGKEEKKNFAERKSQNSDDAKMLQVEIDARQKLEDMSIKADAKKLSREEHKKQYIEKRLKDAAKEQDIDKEALRNNQNLIGLLEKQADIEYTKMHKKDGAKAVAQQTRDLERYGDVLNKTEGLTSQYNNTLESLVRLRNAGNISEENYIRAVEELIMQQPFATEQAKEYNKLQELRNKLFDQGEDLGANYTKTLLQIAEAEAKLKAGKPSLTAEEIEKMKAILETLTPAYRKHQKAIEDSAKAYNKYRLEIQKSLDDTIVENKQLDDRLELIGLTTREQENLSREQKNRNKLLEVELKLQRDISKYTNDAKLKPEDRAKLILEAQTAAAEETKKINREIAIAAAEDFDKEFRKIKEGIADALTDALFEGGKSGSQKLRSVVEAALRKPFNIVINTMVNAILQPLGSMVQSAFGGIVGGVGTGGPMNYQGGLGNWSNLGTMGADALWNGGISAVNSGFTNLGGAMMDLSSSLANVDSFFKGIPGMSGGLGSALGYFGAIVSIAKGDWASGIGAAIGTFILPGIGTMIGSVLGSLVGGLFGRKLKDVGIEGTFGGDRGFEGNTYKFYKGGLFRSNKTTREALDEGTRGGFADQFFAMQTSVENMAESIGLGTDVLKDFTYNFKLSLKDMSDEEIQKALTEEFQKMAEAMGAAAFTTEEYRKGNESQLETLTRLSTSLVSTNAMLDTLNLKLYETSVVGADMASQLVDLFGSMENMQQVFGSYYDNYYNAEEKKATLERQIGKQFEKMNLTMPKTRDEFRKMVEGLDLTTEEGRKMYAFLLQISPLFAQITESTEDLARAAEELKKQITDTRWGLENDLLRAQGNETEAVRREREKELEALRKLDPALAALKEEIWATEDAAKAAAEAEAKANKEKAEAERLAQEAERARQEAITKAMQALQKAVAKEKEALADRMNVAKETISTLKSLFDLIDASIKNLYNQVDSTSKMTYANARKVITSAVTTINSGGKIADISGLDAAINDAMQGLNANDFSTQIEYDRERLRLADELKKLKDTSKQELTVAERELAALEKQVEKLDETLAYWQEQIDIANGTYVALVSVEAAIVQLQNALLGAWSSGNGSGGAGTPGKGGGVLGGTETNTGGGTTPTKPKNSVIGYDSEGRAHYADGSVGQARAGENIYNSTGNVTASGITQEQWEAIKNGGEPFGGYWMNGKYQSNGRYKWDEASGLYVPAFAKGGNYQGGLALVGETGPELINFGSGGRVHTASDTADMLGASSRRMDIMERNLLQMHGTLANIERNTKSSADTLRNCSPNGNAFQMEMFEE